MAAPEGSGSDRYGQAPDIGNRVWRLEERQRDVIRRLDKFEERMDQIIQKQNERQWRMEDMEYRLKASEKRPSGATSLLGESALVRTIFYGLLAMVGALATGQFLNIIGLLK